MIAENPSFFAINPHPQKILSFLPKNRTKSEKMCYSGIRTRRLTEKGM